MFGHGYFGAGYYGPGYWGPGTGAPVVVVEDTHDGVDERVRKRVKRDEEAFKSARERLRDALQLAWDGPGDVAAEIRELASPFVDVLESGALRVDYAALEAKNAAAVLELEASLRAEFQARMAAFEADEEDAVLLLTWS